NISLVAHASACIDQCVRTDHPTDRFASVLSRAAYFVGQLAVRPRLLTSGIPSTQDLQCVAVVECESTHQATADAKRVHVTMLTADRGRHRSEVLACALENASVMTSHDDRPALGLLATVTHPGCW